jgi:ADP-ribosyl-[dinitrogen reductase] hydrolase
MPDKIRDVLLGLAVGDALGVPVEFKSRSYLQQHPVADMTGYGTHNQPPGTWSDDSSLTFCLAESLCQGYDLSDIAQRFVRWYQDGYWTPHGKVFDIGISTSRALPTGTSPLLSGGVGENDNGNGSLMRILPILFYVKELPILERFRIIEQVSGITHAHIRSIVACFIYVEYALRLIHGHEKYHALQEMQRSVNHFLQEYSICPTEERDKFHRILENPIGEYEILPIYKYQEEEIRGSGYVLHTLEASFWCLLKTDNYPAAVLKAVNLGEDTDTTGCVTGGIAGLYYGVTGIPEKWMNQIARKEEIIELANRLH